MAVALPIMAAVAIAGSAMSAYGQMQAGKAAKNAAQMNAKIAEANAAQSEVGTADQLDQLARNTRITSGKQKAGYAKAGVRRTGSALEVLNETQNLHDLDAHRLQQQGMFAKQGFLREAQIQRYQGKVAMKQAKIGAASTLLTGLGNTALSYGMGSASSLPVSTTSKGGVMGAGPASQTIGQANAGNK